MKALRVAVTKNTPGKALQSALAGVDVSSEEVSHLLRLAVARGHAGVAAGMLAAGARPGECLGAELLVAALKADAASLVAPLLRALPADADMEGAAASGWTPLFWAAQRGDAAAVEALLAAGAAVGKICEILLNCPLYSSFLTAQDIKGVLRALLARRPRRRRGTIDKSAIYPHTNK